MAEMRLIAPSGDRSAFPFLQPIIGLTRSFGRRRKVRRHAAMAESQGR